MVLYYILLPLAWIVFHIGFRVECIGRENLKKVRTNGCIIAPNHVSAIDPVFVVITRFWGRRMVVFAKKELFEINVLLTWFFRWMGALCVRGTREELDVIDQTVEACRNGGTLLIFPEGTRGPHPAGYTSAPPPGSHRSRSPPSSPNESPCYPPVLIGFTHGRPKSSHASRSACLLARRVFRSRRLSMANCAAGIGSP